MLKIGDRFDPSELFDGIFIVNPVLAYRGLSPGAKLVWGRMRRFGGKRGKIFPSVATVAQDLGLSLKQTRRYIHELVDEKFMESKGDPGHSNDYHFLWHSAYEGCVGEYRLRQSPLPLKGEVENGENNMAPLPFTGVPTPPFKGSTPLPLKGDIRAEVRAEYLREESPIVPFSEKPQTPDLPETDGCSGIEAAPPPKSPPPRETDLDTPIDKFVPVAYRQEGRSRPKDLAKSKDWLRTVEKEYGPDEFRWLLRCYLQADTPALRKAGWPLRMFLRSPTMNAVYEPTPARIPGPAPVSGPDQDPISPQPALPSPREILDEWNAALPERRYPSARPPTSAVLRDPEFIAVRGQVFAKVKAVLDKDTANQLLWLNFGWVCREKDGNANWIKVLEGTIDSLQAVKAGGRGTKASESVNKARQWIAEWGKKPQAGPPAAPGQPGT